MARALVGMILLPHNFDCLLFSFFSLFFLCNNFVFLAANKVHTAREIKHDGGRRKRSLVLLATYQWKIVLRHQRINNVHKQIRVNRAI